MGTTKPQETRRTEGDMERRYSQGNELQRFKRKTMGTIEISGIWTSDNVDGRFQTEARRPQANRKSV